MRGVDLEVRRGEVLGFRPRPGGRGNQATERASVHRARGGVLRTREDGGRLILEMGGAGMSFVAVAGVFRPESLGADVTLRITSDRLGFDVGEDDWNASN